MKTTVVILSILSVLFPPLILDAAEIVNVRSLHSDHHIIVEYDLMSDSPVAVNVDIIVQGVTYTQEQLSLEGDVGKHVLPGKLRKFVWNVKKDFPKWPNIEVTVKSTGEHLR